MTDFMLSLTKRLTEVKGLAETSAVAYVSRVKTLNNGVPFKSLSFLRKTDDILEKIKPYASSTQKGFISAVINLLDFVKDTPSYRKAHAFYSKWLENATEETRIASTLNQNVMTQKEKDNWLSWEEIIAHRDDMREHISIFCDNPRITETQYNQLLKYFVLCLFTHFPPRRNQDYQKCLVVPKLKDTLPTTENYLSIGDEKFVFNVYKTAKTYGTEEMSFADKPLFQEALACYLKHSPASKGKRSAFPLLVSFTGVPLTQNNAITRILNSIFDKQIGASMLRHIYLSSKWGGQLAEMKEDSRLMGHSLNTQREYVKYVCDPEDEKAVEDALSEIEKKD